MLRRVLIVDDEENILRALKGGLEDEGYWVETASNSQQALTQFEKFAPDAVLLDVWLPDEDGITTLEKIKKIDPMTEVIIMSGHGNVETAVKSIKLGAFDFLEKPIHLEKTLVTLKHVLKFKELREENKYLKEDFLDPWVTESMESKKLLEFIKAVAPSRGIVLIQGPVGVGKELVARMIHQQSQRAGHFFVPIRCANNAELSSHLGRVQTVKEPKLIFSDEGTLFLDDVEYCPIPLQKYLVELIKDRTYSGKSLDFRMIASTSSDLTLRVKQGLFDEELARHLSSIPIKVPALKERKEDIPKLVLSFLQKFSKQTFTDISPTTLKILQDYDWPGNVKELKNWVERTCLMVRPSGPILDLNMKLEIWSV